MHKTTQYERTPLIDYGRLKQMVTIEQVLELAEWQPVAVSGNQLRGPCFIHRSSNPQSKILSVNKERNVFRCFKCDSHGNQLDLACIVLNLGLYEATIELCSRLNIEPPTHGPEKRLC